VNKKIYARVTCSVLPESESSIAELTLTDKGRVESVRLYRVGSYGTYSIRRLGGSTLEQLCKWSCTDYTGTHPEDYCELAANPEGPWDSFRTVAWFNTALA